MIFLPSERSRRACLYRFYLPYGKSHHHIFVISPWLRVRHDIPGTIGRPRFVIGPRRDEGASRDDVTEEATTPRSKDWPLLGPRRFWTAPASHTPGMCALRSLARSTIVSAKCIGYVVTDPKQSLWSFQSSDILFPNAV
jgi:hypothetical protein